MLYKLQMQYYDKYSRAGNLNFRGTTGKLSGGREEHSLGYIIPQGETMIHKGEPQHYEQLIAQNGLNDVRNPELAQVGVGLSKCAHQHTTIFTTNI